MATVNIRKEANIKKNNPKKISKKKNLSMRKVATKKD